MAKNNLESGINELVEESKIEDNIGKKIKYNAWGRDQNNEWKQLPEQQSARQLYNGLAVHTKKEPRERIYAGSSGNYKVVDLDTGLMVGFAKDYDDAVKMSQNQELLDKIKRAKDLHKRMRKED